MRVAVIPARGGSKRIPRKNVREFAGKPIIAYSIEAARAASLFDRIIVSTDDDQIASVARDCGAESPFLRPAELSDDMTGTNAVIKHAIRWLLGAGQEVEYICCIYATAPFIDPAYLREGFARLQASDKSFVFSVTSYGFPIQRAVRINASGSVEAVDERHFLTRSQDLEPYYHDAGQFYWGKTQAFLDDVVMFSPAALALILPRFLVQDIDTQEDWERAELMYRAYMQERDVEPNKASVSAGSQHRSSCHANTGGILVTSVSRKVPMLEAVRAAAKKVGKPFRVIGADTKADCIASYFVDQFWHMPPISALTASDLIDYCLRNGVGFIIPSRDGELEFLSTAREALAREGIAIMISPEDAVRYCYDKLQFSHRLRSRSFPAIATSLQLDDVPSQRMVVKERFGSGAAGMKVDVDRETARRFASTLSNPIYQDFVEGNEFSVDVYVDQSGKCKGAIARRREIIVAGESQVTATEHHLEAESLCGEVAQMLGIRGHAVFQIIESSAKELQVIECNARFGGASTLSIAAGLDSFYWFLLESRNQSLNQYPFVRTPTELRQIRFARDLIIDQM
jgi:pseudaminic acid cytidylyltransferase